MAARAEVQSTDARPRPAPRWHVILHDDQDHTYEYVVRMMAQVFGHAPERGYQIACEVDASGRAICLTTHLEHAELNRDQVLAFGRDRLIARSKGPMSVTLEPAEPGA